MFRLLRFFLIALVCVAIGNYSETIVRYFWHGISPDRNDATRSTVLFATTLLSGLVINLGTIIQIVTQLRRKVSRVDFKYTECLLFGSFVLLVSQMHGTTIEMILLDKSIGLVRMNVISFIATPITTLLSFVCVTIFYAVTKHQEFRANDRHSNNINDDDNNNNNNNNKWTVFRKRYDDTKIGHDIVFVEGTACIGKTTACDVSFDYARYMDERALYARKHELPYVQALYEANLCVDIVNEIANKNAIVYSPMIDSTVEHDDNYYFFDRSNMSQLVYAILFHLDGARCEPSAFAARFEETIGDDRELNDEIRRVFRKWAYVYGKLNRNGDVSFLWYGARTPEDVAARIRTRNGSECRENDWNLTYYTYNQNYVFRRIQEICDLGRYVEVDLITYKSLVADANETKRR